MRGTRWSTLVLVLVVSVAATGAGCTKKKAIDPRIEESTSFGALPRLFIESGAPQSAPQLFERARDGRAAAPCMNEPEPGTLYAKNWLPPRFTWSTPSKANLFELRIRADNGPADFVVYTSKRSWTMPVKIWTALQSYATEASLMVELRGAFYDGRVIHDVTTKTSTDLTIAPVEAPGSIVFWSVGDSSEESRLRGLTMSGQDVVDVLSPNDMPGKAEGERACIGCHTATPDGTAVAVDWEHTTGGYSNDLAMVGKGTQAPGARPAYMSEVASTILGQRDRTLTAFSRAHWGPGDRLMLTNKDADLVWVDLEATSAESATGVLGKHGDPNARRLGPSWSRDGNSIVYMSGVLGLNPWDLMGPADIYMMPFAERSGATSESPASPIQGASSPSTAEYYPALSPDDAWVAFNALPDNGNLYDNRNAEVFVVPRTGGERIRLRANDPPSCTSMVSPGIGNSWPKWAPEVQEHDGRKYYFLVFSSRRHWRTDKPQLYVSPIVVEANGEVTSYPAVHLRSQESFDGWERWGNHTPAWDGFVIQPAPSLK